MGSKKDDPQKIIDPLTDPRLAGPGFADVYKQMLADPLYDPYRGWASRPSAPTPQFDRRDLMRRVEVQALRMIDSMEKTEDTVGYSLSDKAMGLKELLEAHQILDMMEDR